MELTTKLKEWLRQEWRISNHPKYQQYFDKWIENITVAQISGFENQMYRQENNVLGKTR